MDKVYLESVITTQKVTKKDHQKGGKRNTEKNIHFTSVGAPNNLQN
jgi:hypothetical protein